MQLMTEFFNSPEILFAGKLLLGVSMFLCSYAMTAKVTPSVFKSNRMVSQGLAILISLYAFQIPFPPSAGPALIPHMWEVTGLFSLVILAISLVMVKYVSGVGLMVYQFKKRKLWMAFLIGALFTFAIFLPIIVELFRIQLGEYFPVTYNLTWLLNLGLTIRGAISSVFDAFCETIEGIIGKGQLAQTIAIFFIIMSVIVIPQVIPYSNVITKIATTVGIVTAVKY